MRAMMIPLLAVMLASPASAQDRPKLLGTQLSPKHDLEIRYIRDEDTWYHLNVWMINKDDTTQRCVVDSGFFLGTKFFFSPDENWLTANVEVVSNFRTVFLYHRIKGIEYHKVDTVDLYQKAIEFFARKAHIKRVSVFGHGSIAFEKWLPNSKAFLLSLDGWDDENGTAVGNWTCYFNVDSLSVSADKKNHGKVVRGR
jgi:hypothetical protein